MWYEGGRSVSARDKCWAPFVFYELRVLRVFTCRTPIGGGNVHNTLQLCSGITEFCPYHNFCLKYSSCACRFEIIRSFSSSFALRSSSSFYKDVIRSFWVRIVIFNCEIVSFSSLNWVSFAPDAMSVRSFVLLLVFYQKTEKKANQSWLRFHHNDGG